MWSTGARTAISAGSLLRRRCARRAKPAPVPKPRRRAVGTRRQRLPCRCPNQQMGKAMHLGDFISPEAVIPSLKSKNKKQLLQEMSARAARLTGLEERYIFDVLLQRERLGSTGL